MKTLKLIAAGWLVVLGGICLLRADDFAAPRLESFPADSLAASTNSVSTNTPPLPVVTPTGVMNILGKPQVIFTVSESPRSRSGSSYVLSEGQTRAGVKVLKIIQDASTNVVMFDNHGVVQTLPLKAAKISSPPPPSPTSDYTDESENIFRPIVPRNFAGGVQVADFGKNKPAATTASEQDNVSVFLAPPAYVPPSTPPLVNSANAASHIGVQPPLQSSRLLPSTPTGVMPPPPMALPGAAIIVVPNGP